MEGADRMGKESTAAVLPQSGPRESFGGEYEAVESVSGYIKNKLAGYGDDIVIDDAAGPAEQAGGAVLPAGGEVFAFPSARAADVSDFREIKERNIENEIRELTEFYRDVFEAPGEAEGMRTAHRIFMESLYPAENLTLLGAIATKMDERTVSDNLNLMLAVDVLADALRPVKSLAERECISRYEAFMEVYGESLNGRNGVIERLKTAKDEAYRCIQGSRTMLDEIPLAQTADDLMIKYEELEYGLEMNPALVSKLEDPAVKSVVVSMDFNSTFNAKESYPAMELVARVQRELASFARFFRRKYPDKKLLLVINTGRPGHYAWGVAEAAFAPVAEVREVAVGESGGVILERGLHSGKMEVAVDNPEAWKSELDNMKKFISEMIDNSRDLLIEPKMSMLSIRLAKDGEYLLKTIDGRVAHEKWAGEQIHRYLEMTDEYLSGLLYELADEIRRDLPQLGGSALGGIATGRPSGGGDGAYEERGRLLASLHGVMDLIGEKHQRRIEALESRMAVIDAMFRNGELVANYNPTAGFVDIGHRDVNKFSTLMKYVKRTQSVEPADVLYVQIGDSTTDILPVNKTGRGEPNEGADGAFLVAVNNSNEKMLTAVEDRGQYGMFTRNQSILGVEAMFKGLKNLVRRH